MKLIQAIIRPERLEAVQRELRSVLDEREHYRMTVQTCEGHGRQEGRVEIIRGRESRPHLVEKLHVTIALNDAYVEPAVEAILRGARTGQVGDGKIFVTPLEECIRIRTGERGGKAV